MEAGRSSTRKIAKLSDLFDSAARFESIAIDVPIGLLDAYEVGGRECDRAVRTLLGEERGRSVFPAPVRCVLEVLNGPPLPIVEKHQEACRRSRSSGPEAKGISRQAFNILSKIREVDDLLNARPELRLVMREIHPELCFYELAGGKPMTNGKTSRLGKEERRAALGRAFPDLDVPGAHKAFTLKTSSMLPLRAGPRSASLSVSVGACRKMCPTTPQGCQWRSGAEQSRSGKSLARPSGWLVQIRGRA
jgi:Protein of unknown function (DUF429)